MARFLLAHVVLVQGIVEYKDYFGME